ncbi:hypothetical protein N7491_008475 [Penicillium cf. griseofulvum]|uniref:Wax synthase domain-containing protein n=1 Tax=Penicillium cf. griseofulvum TaxID=2972120 RepID=A0A9W9SVP1_9EURO|nr:hypothetical protein N7472_005923 [Penicillium cf. griseofulvum]KAJ5423259.1 hypothetical protein N7491_008475 [Penicillium cf. griseofulvum]KAJ5431469.1 hypothetical protein N7445_009201 [Penicillium cf. griseofulvum]
MDQYQSNGRLLALAILQCLIPSIILITTPKHSILRYLSIPCMICIVLHMMYPAQKPGYPPTNLIGSSATFVLTALDLLLIHPQAGRDFVDANRNTKSFVSRLVQAIQLLTCSRAINTPRQVKNVPSFPEYYTKRANGIPRGRFLVRETAIAVWQFLALDTLAVLALRQAMNDQDEESSVSSRSQSSIPGRKWTEQFIQTLIAWFVVSRILISFYYRVASIVFVSLGDSPSNSPPIIGRMSDMYTLRNFWGKFWHQMLRLPLTSTSNFLARDVLRLPRSSFVERYVNVFVVFFLSGLIHVVIDSLRSVSLKELGTMSFFLSFVVGYMIEDGVIALWKRTRGSQNDSLPAWWQRALGYCWVITWLGVTSPWFFRSAMMKPEEQMVLVPFSVAGLIGLHVLQSIVIAGGIALKFVFEGEV